MGSQRVEHNLVTKQQQTTTPAEVATSPLPTVSLKTEYVCTFRRVALRKLFSPTVLAFARSTGYSWQDKAHTEKMLVNSSSGLCPLPGFAHSWAHARAQPCLDGPTAQGVPSIQALSRPLEQGHRCGRSPARSPLQGPTLVREDSGRTFHILERGGPTWQGGFLPPPCFQTSILFSKAGKKGAQRVLFCQLALRTVQVTSRHVPKCFPEVPTAKTAQTQYKQTKINRKFQHQADAEISGVTGVFLLQEEVETKLLDKQFKMGISAENFKRTGGGGRGVPRVSTMLPRSGNKRLAIKNTPTKMHL